MVSTIRATLDITTLGFSTENQEMIHSFINPMPFAPTFVQSRAIPGTYGWK